MHFLVFQTWPARDWRSKIAWFILIVIIKSKNFISVILWNCKISKSLGSFKRSVFWGLQPENSSNSIPDNFTGSPIFCYERLSRLMAPLPISDSTACRIWCLALPWWRATFHSGILTFITPSSSRRCCRELRHAGITPPWLLHPDVLSRSARTLIIRHPRFCSHQKPMISEKSVYIATKVLGFHTQYSQLTLEFLSRRLYESMRYIYYLSIQPTFHISWGNNISHSTAGSAPHKRARSSMANFYESMVASRHSGRSPESDDKPLFIDWYSRRGSFVYLWCSITHETPFQKSSPIPDILPSKSSFIGQSLNFLYVRVELGCGNVENSVDKWK